MELEFFVLQGTDDDWHKKWVDSRFKWWIDQGINTNKIKLLEITGDDLAHYSKSTVDIMYEFPHGLEELEGIANRTDFDLGSHSKNQDDLSLTSKTLKNTASNTKLAMQDIENKKLIVPYVIEPSAGVDRGVLAILNESFNVQKLDDGKERLVLSFKPHLAPIKAAVIPLKKNNDDLVNKATSLKNILQDLRLGRVVVENTGNIGKNYRKHDEIGTPICITIDFDTLEKDIVTIRDRDTMKQEKLELSKVADYFRNFLLS
jgi:glycyl-tRNA synthetase